MSATENRKVARSVATTIADHLRRGEPFQYDWNTDVRCFRQNVVQTTDAEGNTVMVEDAGQYLPVHYIFKREVVSYDRGMGNGSSNPSLVSSEPKTLTRTCLSWTTQDGHSNTIPSGVIESVFRRYVAIKKSSVDAEGNPVWNFMQTRMLVRGLTQVMTDHRLTIGVEDATGLLTMCGVSAEYDWISREIKVGRQAHRCNHSVVRLHEVMLDVQQNPKKYVKRGWKSNQVSIYNADADLADMKATNEANVVTIQSGRGICSNPDCERFGHVGHQIPFCSKCGTLLTPTGATTTDAIPTNAFDALLNLLEDTATATAIGNIKHTKVQAKRELLSAQDDLMDALEGFLSL